MKGRRSTVLIVEDHPLVLSALKELVQRDRMLELVGSCGDGLSAIEFVEKRLPDIAIVDFRMPGLSGLQFLKEIRSRDLPLRIVLFTAELSDGEIFDAIMAGADGLVFKDADPEKLMECIHEVRAGNQYLLDSAIEDAVIRQIARREKAKTLLDALSPREKDIAMMVAEQLSNKQIANSLAIAEGTVKVHLHKIFSKLGLARRSDLASMLREALGERRRRQS